MSYFSLRKQQSEPEPDEVEEEPEEPTEDDAEGEQPAARGPLLTGLTGPSQWLAARFSPGAAMGVHGIAVWAIFFYGGWIAAGVILAWLVAVLLFVPREHLERLADRIENQPAGEDQEGGEEPPEEPLVVLLWHLIGDAPGAHLKTAARCMQEASGQPVDRSSVRARVTAIRARLGALQIPVKASVRDAAGKVNEGVHRADLKAWEEALSPTGTDTPPEARSGPVATPVTCDVGKEATTVATPRPRLRRLLPRGGA